MFNYKGIKKTLIHIVCMVMLVLIQFDVCGYDLMRACQLADKPLPEFLSAEESSFDVNDEMVSEWSDPVYRGVSPRSFIKAPLLEFPSFIFDIYQRELPTPQRFAQSFQAKLSDMTYLRLCVLLI